MRLKITCCCGAAFEVEDDRMSFIRGGGALDDQGRKYAYEIPLSEWRDLHNICISVMAADPIPPRVRRPLEGLEGTE